MPLGATPRPQLDAAAVGDDVDLLHTCAEAAPVVDARLERERHASLERRPVAPDHVRGLEAREADAVSAVMRELAAREGLDDLLLHLREHLGTCRAGDEQGGARAQ